MDLQTINIGAYPGSGDGDPLRAAFNIINQNFETLRTNVEPLTSSVSSVAGRTGNIILTTQDIVGFNSLSMVPTPPVSSSSPGSPGQVAVDSTSMYLCVATDTWVKAAITTSF
jgi:hypothetical protein